MPKVCSLPPTRSGHHVAGGSRVSRFRSRASVLVKIAGKSLPCEVNEPGTCPYRQQPVTWCETPGAERIPLEPFTADDTHAEPHLPNLSRISAAPCPGWMSRFMVSKVVSTVTSGCDPSH